jgi:hypothetical protein
MTYKEECDPDIGYGYQQKLQLVDFNIHLMV